MKSAILASLVASAAAFVPASNGMFFVAPVGAKNWVSSLDGLARGDPE